MKVLKDINLKEYSNMRVGGTAKQIIFVDDKSEIEKVYTENSNVFLIGNGTNVLFRDGYLDITLLSLKNLKNIKILKTENEYTYVYVEAGANFSDVIAFLREHDLTGIENMTGIPGSMGGIVNMNAGAYGTEIFDVIETVEVLDDTKSIKEYSKKDILPKYRTTNIKKNGWAVISCILKLKKGFKIADSEDKINQRKNKHPLDLPNLGSTFKNPEKEFAAQIISDLGLKNYQVGDAVVSSKHPNFITNIGNATFEDIMGVISHVREVVKEKRGIYLETEIIILE